MIILFKAFFELDHHGILKNNKKIKKNWKTGQRYIGASDNALVDKDKLITLLIQEKVLQRFNEPIEIYVNGCFKFYFPLKKYRTKEGNISKNLPDLSNLYELPQDCLQSVGILTDDHYIESHDGSRRLPSLLKGMNPESYYIEITLSIDDS